MKRSSPARRFVRPMVQPLGDRNAPAIVLLDKDGGFLSRALRYGRADGLLNYPGQLCLTHGYAFVADRNNNRVQVFSILR